MKLHKVIKQVKDGTITHVKIEHITSEELEEFAEALKTNKSLHTLFLERNTVFQDGEKAILKQILLY